ncbi:phospholipase A2 [Streptomyces sp. NPDC020965]|uniref:phospholipase A2 n=1 Tax=Streptomyces sp. NPDC020965 TaxID=3365105 RepID=UPI0037B308F2
MRRTAFPVVTALGMALLLPQQPAAATTVTTEQPPASGQIQHLGPGQYTSDTQSFEVSESDATVGIIGREHVVTAQAGGLAKPESAPASRADMGVFGPGWKAEFLGGQLNRRLDQQSGAIVVTDLGVGESLRYDLTSSASLPGGGGVKQYQATDGSRLTETSRWDSSAGSMVSSVVETLGVDLSSTEPNDDTFTDEAGNPIPAADLKHTYTWKQAAPGSDTWRVTGVGSTATGTSTIGYDPQGRVTTIAQPAAGEDPAQSLVIGYAAVTTAAGSSLGDVAGRAKEITVTSGATNQTVARYAYDASGLLRTVTNPVESAAPAATYTYDTTGRLSGLASPGNGEWTLSFPAQSAAPNAQPVGLARPASESTFQGGAGINDPGAVAPPASDLTSGEITDPQAYPRHCNTPASWMWYTKAGCAAWAAHYGWKKPYWKRLPSGHWVVGVNRDRCTRAADRPAGYNFIAACDMHDYGYGLIGNTYKGYRYYLDRYKKPAVDATFYVTLRDYTCSAYRNKAACRAIAYAYYKYYARHGNPRHGAIAT